MNPRLASQRELKFISAATGAGAFALGDAGGGVKRAGLSDGRLWFAPTLPLAPPRPPDAPVRRATSLNRMLGEPRAFIC